MAKIAIKTSTGSVQITDTLTNVVRIIPRGDSWAVTTTSISATLYWFADAEVLISSDGSSEIGNSIFGATTVAAVTSGLASGAIESSSGSGGAVGGTPADVANGLDASLDLEQIKTDVSSSLVALNQIRNELVNSKSISDLILEDNVGNFYVRQESVDQTTGAITVTLFNLDGTAASPAPVLPLTPVKAKQQDLITEESYTVITAGTGRSIGDIVNAVRIYSSSTGGVLNTVYFNVTTNTVLTTLPVVLTDLKSVDDDTVETLKGMWNNRNRYSNNLYRAITDDLVNNYWRKGDIIQLSFTEQSGVLTNNLSNLSSFAMPNLAIGAVGAPSPGGSFRHMEEKVQETSSFFRQELIEAGFTVGTIYERVSRALLANGTPYQILWYNATSRALLVTPPTIGNLTLLDVTTRNSGSTTTQTLRTVTATDSPEVTALANGTQKSQIVSATNQTLSVLTGAVPPASTEFGIVNIPSSVSYEEIQTDFNVTIAHAAFTVGQKLRRIVRYNAVTGAASLTTWFDRSSGVVTGTVPIQANLALDVTAEPNQTLATSAFTKITSGTNTVDVLLSQPNALTSGLVVRQALDVAGNTQTVNSTLATAGNQKLTDGTSTVAVKIANAAPALADPSLVVSISGNSSTYGSLIPNSIATRAEMVAGIYNLTPPTLTTGQMVPLQLTANGSLKTAETALVTTRLGSVNPAADFALTAGKRVASMVFTNTSAVVVFLQIFDSAVALATGAVPLNGLIYRVPAGSSLPFTVADFGQVGTLYGANTRIGLSSTFGTYTASIAGTLAACSLSVELI